MSKIWQFLGGVLALILIFVSFRTPQVYAEDGSSGDPWIVNDCTELNAVGSGVGSWDLNEFYLLNNDVDCTGVTFTPKGTFAGSPFSGSLNGQNHSVTNLTITSATD